MIDFKQFTTELKLEFGKRVIFKKKASDLNKKLYKYDR